MAKKEEEDKTPYITKQKKLYTHATKLHDTAAHTHQAAYKGAVDKHLIGEDGEVDFDKLDDFKVQKEFIDTMTDAYISKAKQHFKIDRSKEKKNDLDELEKDMLMQAYAGVTKGMIKQYVNRYGKNFKHATFNQFSQELTENLQKQLYASAASHLEEEHVPSIVKYMGLESKLDAEKINVQEATRLLEVFHRDGGITDSGLRQLIPNYSTKKPKPKDDKKKAA